MRVWGSNEGHAWMSLGGVGHVELTEGFFGLTIIKYGGRFISLECRNIRQFLYYPCFRSSNTLASYCTKKFPCTCSVLVVDNGNVVFEKVGTQSPIGRICIRTR